MREELKLRRERLWKLRHKISKRERDRKSQQKEIYKDKETDNYIKRLIR